MGEERQVHRGCAATWKSAPILGLEEVFLRRLHWLPITASQITPKLISSLKHKHLLSHIAFIGLEFGSSLAGWSGLELLVRTQSQCWLGL